MKDPEESRLTPEDDEEPESREELDEELPEEEPAEEEEPEEEPGEEGAPHKISPYVERKIEEIKALSRQLDAFRRRPPRRDS